MRKKNCFILLISAVLLCLLLLRISFAPQPFESPALLSGSQAPNGTLTLWMMRAAEDAPLRAVAQAVSAKTNCAVELTLLSSSAYDASLNLAMTSGMGPDVFELSEEWVGPYAVQGYLADMSGAAASFQDTLLPQGARKHAKNFSDTSIYAVPMGLRTVRLIYNTELFASHHLRAPQSLDELAAHAARIQDGGVSGFALCGGELWNGHLRLMESALSADSIRFYNRETGRIELSGYGAWMDMLTQLQQSGALMPGASSLTLERGLEQFAQGKVGMMLATSSDIAAMNRRADCVPFGIALPPTPSGKVTSTRELLRAGYFAVNAQSAHLEAAKALWKQLYASENLLRMQESGKLLLRAGVADAAHLPVQALPTRNEDCFPPVPSQLWAWTRASALEHAPEGNNSKVALSQTEQNINARIK